MKNYEKSVNTLRGIGKTREALLCAIGIKTLGDLCAYYPRAYEHRGRILPLSEAADGAKHSVILTVASEPRRVLIRRGMSLVKFRACEPSGGRSAEIVYFNQDYMRNNFTLGETYRFFGKVEKTGAPGREKFSLSSPVAERVISSPSELPPLYPIYRLTASLTQNAISGYVRAALAETGASDGLFEGSNDLPRELVEKRGLCSHSFALQNIHFPESLEALSSAKKRLIYEEFFLFALSVKLGGITERKSSHGAPICRAGELSELTALLPYRLTGAQERAIADIHADMGCDTPMKRLICGDVGCGKTIIAAAALFFAVRSGFRAALMAPTEILAAQHYADLEPLFARLGIRVVYLSGSLTAAKKRKAREALAAGEADIVIGTHALISDGVELPGLGLVVTDEQHRFGALQREALEGKGSHPHTLVMSATPIPRSLALTLYGDLDVSIVDMMPSGRQKVDTFVVDESYRARLNAFISKLVREGGQVYIVCPSIEESARDEEEGEDPFEIDLSLIGEGVFRVDLGDACAEAEKEKRTLPPLKSAKKYAEELTAALPGHRIALVHGKMKSSEKDAVMRSFAEGETDILVSTTVIEVGVNVPNACLMIVENAERFGLSQLHQLRGRVGRGSRRSYCVLVSDTTSAVAKERLTTLKNCSSGFEIAEKDLELRGPGDFVRSVGGEIRQSGELRFRLADMCTDAALMQAAFDDAMESGKLKMEN